MYHFGNKNVHFSVVIWNYLKEIRIKPVDYLTFFYIFVNLALIALFYERVNNWQTPVTGYLTCLAVQIFLVTFHPPRQHKNLHSFMKLLRDWYPYLFVSFYYPAIGYSCHAIFADNFDSYLVTLERLIFRSDPSLIFHRLLSNYYFYELMHFFYFFYYFFVLIVGLVLYLKKEEETFDKFIFVLSLMVALQFYFFTVCPTAGPKFYFPELGQKHLPGLGPFSTIMHSMLTRGEIPAGAFPSSHVSVAFLCCLFASQYLSRAGIIFFWFMFTGLLFSTVYLQQHYAIDGMAGIILAFFAHRYGGKIHNFITDYKRMHSYQVRP